MIKFGTVDGQPFAWITGEAWVFKNDEWVRQNSAEVGIDGHVLPEEEFKRKFPSLPPLPIDALIAGIDDDRMKDFVALAQGMVESEAKAKLANKVRSSLAGANAPR